MATTTASNLEPLEYIEWDMPINDLQGGDLGYIDFSKLSMGTEMRNKMWESDNKTMLNAYTSISSSVNSPLLDQNIIIDSSQTSNESFRPNQNPRSPVITNNNNNSALSFPSNTTYNKLLQNQAIPGRNAPITTNSLMQSKPRFGTQPLLQSPIPMPNSSERKTPELLSTSDENGSVVFDNRRTLLSKLSTQGTRSSNGALTLNESQTVKEELLEMKSILTRLAAQTEDISGLPEPVQLALKVIKLEGTIQERDVKIQTLEDSIMDLNNQTERLKRDHEFESAKQKKEMLFLKEKLDYKTNLDASTKGKTRPKDEKTSPEKQEIEKFKEEIQALTETKDQKSKELDDLKSEMDHKIKMLQFDVSNGEKEVSHLKDLINEQQTKEQNRKLEIEHYITAAREAMERERQDRYLLLVEQNKLKHKVEKLSESCKSYQLKNEELCRIQNELEQECDQFRKLKKMIQEHGLPNHEQLIMLQQQTEMFKDDVLSERKDRERAQAQREKLRRDLEILQSRNQSLQEQVYKYQEHIMRLNTGDRRYQHHPEFLVSPQITPQQTIPQQQPPQQPQQQQQPHQGNGKFMRQFSGPAYFNPKLRGSMNMNNALIKNHLAGNGNHLNQPGGGGGANRHNSFTSDTNTNRMMNGFANNHQNRAPMRSSPQGYNSSGQFDPWQQRTSVPQQLQPPQTAQAQQQQSQQQQSQQRNVLTGNFNNVTRSPRSPLLGPNGDPWIVPPTSSSTSQSQPQISPMNQISGGISYTSNIWSQQTPGSPTSFANNTSRGTSQPTQGNWQFSDSSSGFSGPALDTSQMNSIKAIPGGETWSTATDDLNMPSSGSGPISSPDSSDYHSAGNIEGHNGNVSDAPSPHGIGGFQCGKCSMKFQDTESFRGHVEKCFN